MAFLLTSLNRLVHSDLSMVVAKALTMVNNSSMTPQDLLNHFGTKTAIAQFFDIELPAVSRWFADNEVPLGRQYEAQVKTAGRLLAHDPRVCESR
jgi:hypothetical protein